MLSLETSAVQRRNCSWYQEKVIIPEPIKVVNVFLLQTSVDVLNRDFSLLQSLFLFKRNVINRLNRVLFVAESPLQFYVNHSSSPNVTAFGPGLSYGVANKVATFTVCTEDASEGMLQERSESSIEMFKNVTSLSFLHFRWLAVLTNLNVSLSRWSGPGYRGSVQSGDQLRRQ